MTWLTWLIAIITHTVAFGSGWYAKSRWGVDVAKIETDVKTLKS